MEILSSRHFPEENQGNLLVGNVIGFQGILQYKLHDDGASFGAREVEPILSSTDVSFRPSDMKVGPDGAIYFIDWHNPIIGHMQHNLRDPSRDREHGRIYRVYCEGRPLLTPVRIAGEPIAKLLDLLKEPEDRTRYRTRIELGGRDSGDVMAAVNGWVDRLDKSDPEFEHHRLEALWLHQSHNVVDAPLLEQVLASPDFRARAAATRVLCYWRDRVSNSLELLKTLAADPHPRVRLEAVRAASFYTAPEAIEVPLIASDHPSDKFIDFVRGETMKALNPYVKQAIAAGHRINFTTPAGSRYFLRNVSTEDLVKLEPTPEVARELLFRPGVRDEFRRQGVAGVAKFDQQSELAVLLATVRTLDAQETATDESVLFDLVRLITDRPADELHAIRDDLCSLSTGAKRPVTRQLGFVALVAADGDTPPAWTLASKQAGSLLDLVHAVPMIRDPGQRASLYPRVAALLGGLPSELASAAAANQAPRAQFVRIELPGGKRTLTLAEVEVISDGRNVAPGGKASQQSTAFGGDAAKGIDGNKQGAYSGGGQTHSQENVRHPWWEVDLGAELPIESVVVYNRTDEGLGNRLTDFTLKGLNQSRQVVFTREKQPAPPVKAEITLGGPASDSAIRHAAMNALASVRGQEAAAFKAIAPFVASDANRTAAVAALLRIPATYWPAEEAQPLVEQILSYIGTLPTAERTSPPALEAMQVGDALTALLSPADGQRLRRQLAELGVKVIRLGTVTDQMRYDKDQLVVQAGRPLQIVFENTDLMPHNLVITEPGSMAEIGMLAEAAATQPGAVARNYVPTSNKILLSSRLLQPRESQQLAFTAPTKPGVYAYVCTYPGHWRRMYGSLYVVEDLEEYLANPETYVAAHKLVPTDELLKYNRPRTEWKLEDLAGPVNELASRSFSSGKQLFQVASCVTCHKLGDTGQEFGPDLAKLDPKQTSSDILLSLLEPSKKIDDKYASYTIELDSGKVVTGMILSETNDVVNLIENPLAKIEPLAIKKTEIVSRAKATSSIMPKGLLDKLTREEILDLIGYVSARGDAGHELFHGAHDHGHGGH